MVKDGEVDPTDPKSMMKGWVGLHASRHGSQAVVALTVPSLPSTPTPNSYGKKKDKKKVRSPGNVVRPLGP